jgi:hypothetical protein
MTRSVPVPLFSPRLDEVLDQITSGTAPNAGRFCGYCYTPLAPERTSCPHCGRATSEYPPEPVIPDEIVWMYRELRRRERLVVHSFTYLALALTVVLTFLTAWFLPGLWKLLALLVLAICYFGLITLLAGIIGDRLGYAYARRGLERDWAEYSAARAAQQTRRQA